jgi:hypothetical protein
MHFSCPQKELIIQTISIRNSFKCTNYILLDPVSADPVAARSQARALIAHTLDRGFESRLRHGCLSSSFYVVLSCVGKGLATS